MQGTARRGCTQYSPRVQYSVLFRWNKYNDEVADSH
jgi:hypothetical protein